LKGRYGSTTARTSEETLREFGQEVRDDVVSAWGCVEEGTKPDAAKALLKRASDNIQQLLRLITQIERPWEK
jgi:hypothetical protein